MLRAARSGAAESGVGGSVVPLRRRSAGRIVGGVAGGLADHLGIDVFPIRVAFAVLAVLGGSGIVAYGLLWMFTSVGDDVRQPSADERRRAYGLIAMALAGAAALGLLAGSSAGWLMIPLVAVGCGAALVWREFDFGGQRPTVPQTRRARLLTAARVVTGVAMVLLGVLVVVAFQVDLGALRSSMFAAVATLMGVGLLTVPLWMRLVGTLSDERAARIRNEEREEIASHLHDSVLQTLALIQKQADRPGEVARLARSQERELRRWLFGDDGPDHATLSGAMQTIAGEVEDTYAVTVDPVIVGEVPLDDGRLDKRVITALLGATRESLVNAAKHSGCSAIDLFVEAGDEQVSVFVRDRGRGFDVDAVSEDRRGVAVSIRRRIERRGGSVDIWSEQGRGTEIGIHVPLGPVTGANGDDASEDGGEDADPSASAGDRADGNAARDDGSRDDNNRDDNDKKDGVVDARVSDPQVSR
ncbi:ATP-binding protein [Millisia brevis]|uniref:ATP-binding protein n=1 Tax=Millisia brevis TaxID=264148 RepID=UPI000A05B02D|nr:ATP-binding protein [Millisia brevis]